MRSNERSTANPNSLNGSKISQRIGYSNSPRIAIGQHNTNRIHQSRKLIISTILSSVFNSCSTVKSGVYGTKELLYPLLVFHYRTGGHAIRPFFLLMNVSLYKCFKCSYRNLVCAVYVCLIYLILP